MQKIVLSLYAIFGKVGRNAPEEVVLELIRSSVSLHQHTAQNVLHLPEVTWNRWTLLLTDFWWHYFDLIIGPTDIIPEWTSLFAISDK